MSHGTGVFRDTGIHVDDGGSGGVPIVFLHAFGGCTTHWSRQLDFFRASGRAIAFDFPAHGASAPAADGDYSIGALARSLGDVMDDLELPSVMLVGHSLGGATAIAYAGSHPERVAALVIEEAPGKLPDEHANQMKAALERSYHATMEQIWTRLLDGAQPATRRQVLADKTRLVDDVARALIEATFAYDPLPDLARYSGPTLSITGDGGDVPNALHLVAPNVLHQTVAGTSHWIQLDKPDVFNALLEEFAEQRVR